MSKEKQAPPIVSVIETCSFDKQMSKLDNEYWSVARLAKLAESLVVFDLQIRCIDLSTEMGPFTLRSLAGQAKAIMSADYKYPVILDEYGSIMDGRHRIMRALIEGRESVKAVRFDVNPAPCRVDDEDE